MSVLFLNESKRKEALEIYRKDRILWKFNKSGKQKNINA
jgi:hypothetical protein